MLRNAMIGKGLPIQGDYWDSNTHTNNSPESRRPLGASTVLSASSADAPTLRGDPARPATAQKAVIAGRETLPGRGGGLTYAVGRYW